MSAKILVGKLLLVPLAIENGFVLVVGLTGGMMWVVGGVVGIGSSDPWEAFLTSWLTFSGRVTLSFTILGGLAWFLRRVRSRPLAAPIGADTEASQPWFFLVTVVLGTHGVLAAVFAHPLLSLFQENIRLLQGWGVWEGLRRSGEFSGIFLVPVFGMLLTPSLAAMTALSFITGAAASLGYLLLGFEGSPRVLLRSICLQIAFLLGLYFTHALFEAGTRLVTEGFGGPDAIELRAQVLPWLSGQAGVIVPMTRGLAWLLPGFFICAAVVLRRAHERQLRDGGTPMPFSEEIAEAGSAQPKLPGSFLEPDERFKHKGYLIKWKFLSNPIYKVFEVYDSDNILVFVARLNGLSLLTRVIKVYGTGKAKEEALSIVGRRVFRFPDVFDITYCSSNKKVGTFKNSRTGWKIMDEYGRQIAAMKMEEAASGSAKFQISAGCISLCRYVFKNVIRPTMMIDLSDDSAGIFDRKLAIGLALVLCFKSVAFNYSHSYYS